MSNVSFKKNIFFEILFLSVLSYVILIFIYPERYLDANLRFTSGHDIGVPFYVAFAHANFIDNGFFDFWNINDQVNHSFTQIIYGFHTLAGLIEGIIFKLFSYFFYDKSLLIHLIHSYLYQFFCIFFVSWGSILIFRIYNINFSKRLFLCIISNTLLSVQIILGLLTSLIYSLIPLLIYFILQLYFKKKLIYLLYFITLYIFCFAQIPVFALGYMFVPFHFIFIILILLCFYYYFNNKKKFNISLVNFFDLKLKNYNYFVIASCLIIILFNFSYLLVLRDTISLSHEGIDSPNRFERIFNPIMYFKHYTPNYLNIDLFKSYFNYNYNAWYDKPLFLGIVALLLSISSIIYSKKKEIIIFAMCCVYLICIQGPRDLLPLFPSFYAHAFNSLTNPFAFLIQHTHMSLLALPFFMIPLIAQGTKSIGERIENKKIIKEDYFFLLIIIILLIVEKLFLKIDNSIILEHLFISIIFIIALFFNKIILSNFNFSSKLLIFVFIFSIFLDLKGLNTFLKYVPYTGEKILNRNFENPNNKINSFVLDYQNPTTGNINFKMLLNNYKIKFYDENNSKKFLQDEYFSRATYYGLFFNNVFLQRLLQKPMIYEIRHKSFSNIYKDVDFKSENRKLLPFVEFISDKNQPLKNEYIDFKIDIEPKNLKLFKKKTNFDIYFYKLKNISADYLKTNIFYENQEIGLKINDINFLPVQNSINLDFQYDFNNFKKNTLFFSLPKNMKVEKVSFHYKKVKNIKNIFLNKNKYHILIDKNKNNKKILIRIPYDKNWIIKNNGKKIEYYKEKDYWVSVKLNNQQENNIIISYNLGSYFINNFTLILYYLSQIFLIIFLWVRSKKIKV